MGRLVEVAAQPLLAISSVADTDWGLPRPGR
jgi:hypothetical protein